MYGRRGFEEDTDNDFLGDKKLKKIDFLFSCKSLSLSDTCKSQDLPYCKLFPEQDQLHNLSEK